MNEATAGQMAASVVSALKTTTVNRALERNFQNQHLP